MTSLHLLKDRDRSETWRRLQHRDHFRLEEVREGIGTATGSHLLYGRRRSMSLLEAIGGDEADRCLRGRDCWAVCLSERHVKPHLVIGDMAAGQWVDSFDEEIHPRPGRSRSHDDRGPRESFVASRCGTGTSGRAPPSLRHQPRNDFLILIVGDSHLDCRAAVDSGHSQKVLVFGAAGYPVRHVHELLPWNMTEVRPRLDSLEAASADNCSVGN